MHFLFLSSAEMKWYSLGAKHYARSQAMHFFVHIIRIKTRSSLNAQANEVRCRFPAIIFILFFFLSEETMFVPNDK